MLEFLLLNLVACVNSAAFLVVWSGISSARRAWKSKKDPIEQQRKRLRAEMVSSKSYFEWSLAAAKLDALEGTDQEARWRQETEFYDRRLLEDKVAHLRKIKNSGGGVLDQMFSIRADLLRNLGNITNSELHEHFPVVPRPIRDYIDEVKGQLQDITWTRDIPLEDRVAFLKETRHAFGRTALVMSGGGTLGSFHLGVVKALLQHRLLPRVLAGTSTGAIVAAIAATRNDSSLNEFFESLPKMDLGFMVPQSSIHVLKYDGKKPQRKQMNIRILRQLLGDLTFLEAYGATGRVLNLSVHTLDSQDPPRLLNYLTSPDILIWSAVAAAAGLPLANGKEGFILFAKDTEGRIIRFATKGKEPRYYSNHQHSSVLCKFLPMKYTSNAASMSLPGRFLNMLETNTWQSVDLVLPADDLPFKSLSETFSVNHILVSQTDPHIVPLMNIKKHLGVCGQVGEAELRHRCLQALDVLPGQSRPRWLRRMAQPWEGDVTISPKEFLLQIQGVILGSSNENMLKIAREGEIATWAKLSAIQCNCGIEVALDECIQTAYLQKRTGKDDTVSSNFGDANASISLNELKHNNGPDEHTFGHAAQYGSKGGLMSGGYGPFTGKFSSNVCSERQRLLDCNNSIEKKGCFEMVDCINDTPFSPRESVLILPYGTMKDKQYKEKNVRDDAIFRYENQVSLKQNAMNDCIDYSANPFGKNDALESSIINDMGTNTLLSRRSLDVIAP